MFMSAISNWALFIIVSKNLPRSFTDGHSQVGTKRNNNKRIPQNPRAFQTMWKYNTFGSTDVPACG